MRKAFLVCGLWLFVSSPVLAQQYGPATGSSNIYSFGGVKVNLGQQITAASIPVTLPSDGILPLPTGAATASLQPTNAGQGSTTSGQTGTLVLCAVSNGASYATGTSNILSCTTAGMLRATISSASGSTVIQNFSSGATASTAGIGISGIYHASPVTVTDGQAIGLGTDNNGNIQSAPTRGVPVTCGLTTSATPGNPSTVIAANLVNRHIMLQNNGTATILFSFTATTGLTATGATPNAFTLAAGQPWTNPNSFIPTSALTVASGTASQPLSCEYN